VGPFFDKLGNSGLMTELSELLPLSRLFLDETPEEDAVLKPRLPGLIGVVLIVNDSTFSVLAL
jgi:hypothetical protein